MMLLVVQWLVVCWSGGCLVERRREQTLAVSCWRAPPSCYWTWVACFSLRGCCRHLKYNLMPVVWFLRSQLLALTVAVPSIWWRHWESWPLMVIRRLSHQSTNLHHSSSTCLMIFCCLPKERSVLYCMLTIASDSSTVLSQSCAGCLFWSNQ